MDQLRNQAEQKILVYSVYGLRLARDPKTKGE